MKDETRNIETDDKNTASKTPRLSIFFRRILQVKKILATSANITAIAKIAEKNANKSSTKTSTPKIDIPSSIMVFSSRYWACNEGLQRAGRRSPLIATRNNFRS